ncbi:MAG: metal ABC transporter permease [Candidatus Kerfeldbacteria bacterium CG08_land_8_20_14_0_20_40_16]|uniref:Metal ABC transporter permease n=1 Tax=Candidatus Kerfeldbacteria bacterium CG08_land_8_20_14_0_20_40_16 TaxID=2014244 RepID=A0A2H0YZ06_9BACT|nr:MAG: metal ABC transporter permease [Candidatus Kerfeldbacteria bacterium CG08_land_8_20_14_0_20_40_16]
MAEIFQLPFMQRALMAGIILAFLLAFIGIFVILRRMAFFGDGIAHASLAGIAIAILADLNPILIAIVFSIIIALIIYLLEKKTSLSSDTIIGIFFTASMSLGVLLISFKEGYQPELISFLFGNILAIRVFELYLIVILAISILTFLILFFRKITLVVFDRETAYISGINVTAIEITLYLALAVSIVLGVKILGIVLVSALLIIPASIAKLVASSFKGLVVASVILSEIIVILGIFLSYYFNWPTGATIVLTGTAWFIVTFIFSKILKFKSS